MGGHWGAPGVSVVQSWPWFILRVTWKPVHGFKQPFMLPLTQAHSVAALGTESTELSGNRGHPAQVMMIM